MTQAAKENLLADSSSPSFFENSFRKGLETPRKLSRAQNEPRRILKQIRYKQLPTKLHRTETRGKAKGKTRKSRETRTFQQEQKASTTIGVSKGDTRPAGAVRKTKVSVDSKGRSKPAKVEAKSKKKPEALSKASLTKVVNALKAITLSVVVDFVLNLCDNHQKHLQHYSERNEVLSLLRNTGEIEVLIKRMFSK